MRHADKLIQAARLDSDMVQPKEGGWGPKSQPSPRPPDAQPMLFATPELFFAPPEPASQPKHKATVRRGYASTPGTGPEGETCKTCDHYTLVYPGDRPYRKCGLRQATWTGGQGTDILASSPACRFWTPDTGPAPIKIRKRVA